MILRDLTDMPYEALLELEQSLSEGSKRDDVVAEIKRRTMDERAEDKP